MLRTEIFYFYFSESTKCILPYLSRGYAISYCAKLSVLNVNFLCVKTAIFELFYIVLSGPFIADYAVCALLIVEGRTVTYSC